MQSVIFPSWSGLDIRCYEVIAFNDPTDDGLRTKIVQAIHAHEAVEKSGEIFSIAVLADCRRLRESGICPATCDQECRARGL